MCNTDPDYRKQVEEIDRTRCIADCKLPGWMVNGEYDYVASFFD